MSIHELTAAKIKYLVTLLRLDPNGRGVRSIALAKELNISRPSVCAMLTKLAHEGYLNKEHYGIVYLCEKGKEIGKTYSAVELH